MEVEHLFTALICCFAYAHIYLGRKKIATFNSFEFTKYTMNGGSQAIYAKLFPIFKRLNEMELNNLLSVCYSELQNSYREINSKNIPIIAFDEAQRLTRLLENQIVSQKGMQKTTPIVQGGELMKDYARSAFAIPNRIAQKIRKFKFYFAGTALSLADAEYLDSSMLKENIYVFRQFKIWHKDNVEAFLSSHFNFGEKKDDLSRIIPKLVGRARITVYFAQLVRRHGKDLSLDQ